jgi:hypothetical protein
MTTKTAKELQVNDILIDGIHRQQILQIVSINNKVITFKFKVISEASRGFGNIGTEYKRLNTKIKIQ